MSEIAQKKGVKSFSPMFWLVIFFEFIERGSYYGMMSFISVYFVDVLSIPRENVGVIKGVIQPLLYFLPIISGALADRFGFRRLLMVAFTLLGGGYFLTSQMTSYGAVFASLVIMGFGAGTFKPLISGIIAKNTNEENSSLGFGVYYWSINIGAFLFPLLLVPFLKAINPSYVIIAAAICTASMIIPTIFLFKDPVKQDKVDKRNQATLIQTLANAFEIIYSPVVLIYHQMRKSMVGRIVWAVVLGALTLWAGAKYIQQPVSSAQYARLGVEHQGTVVEFEIKRNMLGQTDYSLSEHDGIWRLEMNKPEALDLYAATLITDLQTTAGLDSVTTDEINSWIVQSDAKLELTMQRSDGEGQPFTIESQDDQAFTVLLHDYEGFDGYKGELLAQLKEKAVFIGLTPTHLDNLYAGTKSRAFFMLFVFALVVIALGISAKSFKSDNKSKDDSGVKWPFIITLLIGTSLWLLPGLSLLGRIISSVIYISATSLFIIDKSSQDKFIDHAKFLLMIVLYSGFWVLYFQMFDSVLWYVQAYVDATSLNNAVNSFIGLFGVESNWFFDVEHVTVINAGTIILLQLVISAIVRKRKALPTMMFGIALGTIGMAILAINTSIWVFMAGIAIFSIGEMTAHPKFISYIGLTAPKDRKAMYMGYIFLYGVFGSSVGGIVGAKLYVHYVDILNQPRTLWLVFSGIGVFTIVALALYNKFLKPKNEA